MIRKTTGSTLASVLFFLSIGGSLLSAQVQEIQLSEAETTWSESFGYVAGLLERPDGRVLVADPLGQVLVLLDMESGTADTIGRVGAGPEEYRQPDGLYALPGDSVLLVDLGNGRLVALGPDYGFGETWTIAQGGGGFRGGTLTLRVPVAVDSQGRVYFRQRMPMSPGSPMPDSSYIVRWDRSTDAVDTVGMIKEQEMNMSTGGGANTQRVSIQPVPMSPQDGWSAGLDGRVAAVRSADYHVDWIALSGEVVNGPSNQYRRTRVGRADKEAYLDRQQRENVGVQVSVVNGAMTTALSRGAGQRSRDRNLDDFEWPDELPPFQPAGISVAPNGELWAERYTPVGDPTVYDVFDGTGTLVKRITLPEGRQIVGYGENALYVARSDEFDLIWLEKYVLR